MRLEQTTALQRTDAPAAPPDDKVIVDTRFGVYEFTSDNTIVLPQGLVGFPDHQMFGLANLPDPVPEAFKLLQSLSEPPISFIVMPCTSDSAPIEQADIGEACAAVGCTPGDVHLLLICTVKPRSEGEGIDLTANVRAPIVVDLDGRRGRQYVLPNDRYPTRQPLGAWDEAS